MNLWKIAWRSLEHRSLSTTLTAVSMALGVALVVAVLVMYSVVGDSFRQSAQGFDIIVGAKGGKLQLVLNTVYHLSTPIENLPWNFYQEFKKGKFADQVSVAIPYCLGDNYEGFRVVGTVPEMFDLDYAEGKHYAFAEGKVFEPSEYFTAVVGSLVARKTGLKVGDQFQPTHGVREDAEQGHKHDAFTVVGVLGPTGTPNDRAVFVNIEGFFLLEGHAKGPGAAHDDAASHEAAGHTEAEHAHEGEHEHAEGEHAHDEAAHAHEEEHAHAEGEHAHDEAGHAHAEGEHAHDEHEHGEGEHAHDEEHAHAEGEHAHTDHEHGEHHHHEPLPDDQREVTAILLRGANPLAALSLVPTINEGQVAQAVLPAREIYNLMDGIVFNVQTILLALAILVVVVSSVSIMVGIYNSMNDRRREIAIMRSLGASRATVMRVVLCESILLSLLGGIGGVLLGHAALALTNPWIVSQTGVSIGFLQFTQGELLLIPGLIVLAAAVGYLPALSAYRTDVSRSLGAAP